MKKKLNCDYKVKIQELIFEINFYDYNTKKLFQSFKIINNIKDSNEKKKIYSRKIRLYGELDNIKTH